jgi:hypothetical protein
MLNRIDKILIPPRYTFLFRSPTTNNSRVKRAWPEANSGCVAVWEIFPGVHE